MPELTRAIDEANPRARAAQPPTAKPIVAKTDRPSTADRNHAFETLIAELEETFPVDRWVVDTVHIWPIIRFHLFHSYFDHQFFKGTPRAGTLTPRDLATVVSQIIRGAWGYAAANIRDFRRSILRPRPCDALFLNYNTYMTLLNGHWYSRVCDPLIEHLAGKGLSSTMLTGGYRYAVPRATASMLVQPQLTAYRGAAVLSPPSRRMIDLSEIEAHVRKSGLFDASFTVTKPVERQARQIRGIKTYFTKLLQQVRPKVVFVTCCYGTESMACILACHELGIPTVDIQHGSQGDFHMAYGRWSRVPSDGYELLPTVFWCWSESEALSITKWSQRLTVHQPISGGNLFLDRWVLGLDETVKAYDRILEDLKAPSKERIQVLYTLNGCSKNELQELVDTINHVHNSGLAAHFWVRLHPVTLEQKGSVERILQRSGLKHYDIDNATALPLYALLRHMDVHITEFSSVVIEAEAFQVPSIIGELGIPSFPDQIASGWATPAGSVDEIVGALRRLIPGRPQGRVRPAVSTDAAVDRLMEIISKHSSGRRDQSPTEQKR